MAKRSRDDGGRRETTRNEPKRQIGGIRNAGVVKTVSRNIKQQRAYARAELPDLDLSAFQDDYRADHLSAANPDRYEPARAAQSYSPAKGRNQVAASVRTTSATPKLLAKTQANRQPGRASILQARKPAVTQARPSQFTITASPNHLQAKPSEKRKEQARDNCKQRPEPKKSGRGVSRSFVPWCDRKG